MAPPNVAATPANNQAGAMARDQPARPQSGIAVIRRSNRARLLRPILMTGGVLVVAIAGLIFWLSGGRYISSDDTYVTAAKVSLSTSVSGLIAEVDVRDNQYVTAGQVLFRLDPTRFRIAIAGAEAQLNQTKLDVASSKHGYAQALAAIEQQAVRVQNDQADLQRYASVVANGGVTRATYDDAKFKLQGDQAQLSLLQAQAGVQLSKLAGDPNIDPENTPAYQSALANLNNAKRDLFDSVVTAPFDGYVTQVEQLQPGMFLPAGAAAFGLVSAKDIWVAAQPKESQLTWVRPGQSVDISVDTYPGQKWTGTVQSLSPASGSSFSILPAQNSSGNWVKVVQRIPLRVEFTGGPKDFPLRDGMSAEISIDTHHKRHLF
jgi:membrane fusion protein (multidrug efflux system)